MGARPKTAVFIAHPGHELRIFHWVELNSPTVLILTDGSGMEGTSRLQTTSRILEHASARPGPIYGRVTERDLYARVLGRDLRFFLALAEELAAFLESERIDRIAGDAAEGREVSHDLCRHLTQAACRRVERLTGRRIEAFQFPLHGDPREGLGQAVDGAIQLRLDETAVRRKIATALDYRELAAEVEEARLGLGFDAFATEVLFPADRPDGSNPDAPKKPGYETRGEELAAAGVVGEVIRYREHILPIAAALAEWAAAGGP